MRLLPRPVFLVLATGLVAQAPEHGPWFQAKVAEVQPDTCHCIKELSEVGAGLGTWVTPRWGTEVDFLTGTLISRHTTDRANETHLMGSVLFGLNPGGEQWLPYLRTGLGAAQVGAPYSLHPGATTSLSIHAGLGIQAYFGSHLMTSLEARAVTIETRVARAEKQALLGLGFHWGVPAGMAPISVAPAPLAMPEPTPPPREEAPVLELPVPEALVPVPEELPPAPEPAPPAPEIIAKVVLDDATLHFANGKAEISPKGDAALRGVAVSLKVHALKYDLVVTGHTSSVGGRAFNLALSKRRAEAVTRILIEEGVPASRIRSLGIGPDQPIADNATKEGQARNRRVEIEVKGAKADIQHTEDPLADPARSSPRVKRRSVHREKL